MRYVSGVAWSEEGSGVGLRLKMRIGVGGFRVGDRGWRREWIVWYHRAR